MKRLFLVLAALLFLVIVAAAIFLATFDADRYRPQLAQALEDASGLGVRLGHVSLGWRGGLALELRGLTVYESRAATGEPLLELESASTVVRLMPLLQRRVEVGSVILRRPSLRLARDTQGRVSALIPAAAPSPATAPGPAAGVGRPAAATGSVVSFNIESLRIEDGTLHWSDASVAPPIELLVKALDVSVAHIAPGRPMEVRLQAAVAGDAPNVRLGGRLTLPGGSTPGSLERLTLSVERLALERVMPAASRTEPRLQGRLSASLEGDVTSLEPATLARAASARGSVRMEEPVVVNLNLLREVFRQLSMIPGLLERLQERLPETYRAKLEARDTVLQSFELPLELSDGSLRFSGLSLQSDTLGLSGSGTVGLDGSLALAAILRVDPQFSAALIRSVEELRALTNAKGELELPLAIQGRAPRVAVVPDVKYVASRVLTATAVEALGKFLQRDAPAEEGQGTAPPDAGGLLGQLLQKAIERHVPSDSSFPSGGQ